MMIIESRNYTNLIDAWQAVEHFTGLPLLPGTDTGLRMATEILGELREVAWLLRDPRNNRDVALNRLNRLVNPDGFIETDPRMEPVQLEDPCNIGDSFAFRGPGEI